jgi:hypothetical protein
LKWVLRSVVAIFAAFSACTEPTAPAPPAIPQNVTASLLTPTSALGELVAGAPGDGVVSYNVLRNGAKVGESTSTTFTDTGLNEQTTYKYSVSANGPAGVQSPASAETAAATSSDTGHDRAAGYVKFSHKRICERFHLHDSDGDVQRTHERCDHRQYNLHAEGDDWWGRCPGYSHLQCGNESRRIQTCESAAQHDNYTATVAISARDVAGNALASPFTFSFTTLDQTPPTITSTSPVNGATGVSATTQVVVTFSEAMDAATINAANITLRVTSTQRVRRQHRDIRRSRS